MFAIKFSMDKRIKFFWIAGFFYPRKSRRQMAVSTLRGIDGKVTNFQVVFLVCSRMTRQTFQVLSFACKLHNLDYITQELYSRLP